MRLRMFAAVKVMSVSLTSTTRWPFLRFQFISAMKEELAWAVVLAKTRYLPGRPFRLNQVVSVGVASGASTVVIWSRMAWSSGES